MLRKMLDKIKQWTHFPTVKQPPMTVVSPRAKAAVFINTGIALILYALLGDKIIASVAIGLFLCAIFVHRLPVQQQLKVNQRFFLIVLCGICLIIFFLRFHGSTGGRSWMGLLALLTAIKLFETRTLRDYFVAIILLYFFTSIIFAYNNSALAPIVLTLFTISSASALMLLSASNETNLVENRTAEKTDSSFTFKQVGKQVSYLFLQALPIAIILFFLFPRIQGSFGFLPDEDSNLDPGFSDSLSAGEYRQRSTSNSLAFRVNFEGINNNAINPDMLYWRVKTMSRQQGFSWRKHPVADLQTRKPTEKHLTTKDRQPLEYVITHQPTADQQLPSLERVTTSSEGSILKNHSLLTKKDFSTTFQYRLSSIIDQASLLSQSTNTPAAELPASMRQVYLQTVLQPQSQTQQLLNSWLKQHNLPEFTQSPENLTESIVNPTQAKNLALTVLRHFREQPFKYHLLPPELDQAEPIEDFLFRTQSGYCEHYASTFSTIMRWLGVPSRVVVGYQGAEYNPQGDFYEVRYSSAHAWSEIWTADSGWIRIDPTAAVAPERIEFGMDALLALLGDQQNAEFESGQFSRNMLADALNPSGSRRVFKSASQWLASANHSWDKWIVNYNFEQQAKLLKSIGLNTKNQYVTLVGILGIGLAIIFGIIIFVIWPRKAKLPPMEAAFALFKEKLKKQQVDLPIAEGPQDLQIRLSRLFPDRRADIQAICQYYIHYKYQNKTVNASKFTEQIKQFNLSAKHS